MKKVYMVGLVLLALSAAGCTLKPSQTIEEATGDVQELTWTELTGTELTGTTTPAMEEFTGEFDSWVVPTLAGSENVTTEQRNVINEINKIINQRNPSTIDETKLTEEDISDMEKFIEIVRKVGEN